MTRLFKNEAFYLGKIENPLSPRSPNERAFSFSGDLLPADRRKKLRSNLNHEEILEKYLRENPSAQLSDGCRSHEHSKIIKNVCGCEVCVFDSRLASDHSKR